MKYYFINSLLIISSIFFYFRLHQLRSKVTEDEKQVYMFDEVPEEKTIEAPKTGEYPNLTEAYYVVQIGALLQLEDKSKGLFAEI
ncbi:MAG: hypothetical protein MZV64_45270 [Ignavibacteriales bacterium]|nr:hypothetical protein [Ignavibacteriales bacterium]